ncbi:MAG: 16S rRNA (adenine(1518)-N(6)/adenine(1519)-N(6))-dimethyltransferase RsmA [Planctomycetota bacterium]
MAQTKNQIRELLERARTRPKHRFGQNFMVDGNLTRVVADAGELTPDDTALEVGPGTGTLTDELLERAGKVVAFEIDRDLATLLRTRMDDPRFELIEGDALSNKHTLHPRLAELAPAGKLVANLPYNIASPLIIELLAGGCGLLAFTVQKEVADRLSAGPGSKIYGPLSVMAQALGSVEVMRTLPASAFWPPPKIVSSLVRIRRSPRVEDAAGFGVFVGRLFQQRRKMLRAIINVPAGFDETVRPERLSVDELIALHGFVAVDDDTRENRAGQ